MAASGSTPISLYYSATTTNAPLAANLVNGELAINIADGILFYKDNTGTVQQIVGGGSITNDTTSLTAYYPLFARATTGFAKNVYTSNANFVYTPGTGELKANALVASNGLVVNNLTVGSNYTIPAGYAASSVGPITINGGVIVTVPSGSRWLVL